MQNILAKCLNICEKDRSFVQEFTVLKFLNSAEMNRIEGEKVLAQVFGFDHFHDTQWRVIDQVLKGKRVLLIEKTGFGKSLCYQFPATQMRGLTIVFSPLIALMRDQVKKLQSKGIKAEALHSQQTPEENAAIMKAANEGQLKILYVAPERIESGNWLEFARQLNLAMIVIDEAHCISTWGHDFRPSYRRIVELVNMLPDNFPVLAVTATATKTVESDIVSQIKGNIQSLRGKLLRPNLRLLVIKVQSEEEKMIWLAQNLNKIQGTGVIYTGTRFNTSQYAKWLQYLKIDAIGYNAGLETDERRAIENGLINNTYKCVVSTNALGMGIDKPDIRFVIHTQMPVSPIHYYQEIGRAGRDGKPSIVILFFNPNEDTKLPSAFIENGKPSTEKYEATIEALKSDPLGQFDLQRAANLKMTWARVIKSDLLEQGIVEEVNIGKSKKLQLVSNAPPFDPSGFEALRASKWAEFEQMLAYIHSNSCRMKFLCDFLGDEMEGSCKICDNDIERVFQVIPEPEQLKQLAEFQESDFPILELETSRSKLSNGIAVAHSLIPNIALAIENARNGKGENYPDYLVKQAIAGLKAQGFQKQFDLILHIPSAVASKSIRDFADRLSVNLQIPISDDLQKLRATKPQSTFNTGLLKADNVKGAFFCKNPDQITGKSILLIDDFCDSGYTFKEIGRILSGYGAKLIFPLAIAKATAIAE